jgi:hypothetical protein
MTKDCCGGPFKYGKPAVATNPNQQCFVGCCGNMCPPDDCCDSVLIYFECGSTKTESYSMGCDCIYDAITLHGVLFKKKNNIPSMPAFNLSQDENSEFVFGLYLGVQCSIPCSQVMVTLTTTGCCLYLSGQTVYAVGSGSVSAQISASSVQGCGEIKVQINGIETTTIDVEDGDAINVTVVPSEPACCNCCEVARECTSTGSMWVLKEVNNKKFLSLNKNKFIKRMNILRREKIIRKNKKLR